MLILKICVAPIQVVRKWATIGPVFLKPQNVILILILYMFPLKRFSFKIEFQIQNINRF